MMDPDRYMQVQQIFDHARQLVPEDRGEFLEAMCADDLDLRSNVEMLLKHHESDLTLDTMTVATPVANAGQIIERYKLLQKIGEGGFGEVWMAEQREPVQRRVALKIIKLGMDTKQVIARFEAERQALAMMDHPHIAKVLDAGATETGRPYFVMELVRGLPITEYCDRERLSIQERLSLIADVCHALQHAHQKGVIHRDIKPSNVLVGTLDDKPMPKIIDFGIAKATTARLTERTLFTEFRQMIGTPEYMSPEQAGESAEDTDTRTDVYSVGVLLYELITGLTPFDSEQLRSAAFGEIQRIIREVDPPRPSTRVSEHGATLPSVAEHRHTEPRKLGVMIRGELDWIVMKALEKDRARRYDSAGAMARDIQRYLNGEAIEAAPPSAMYRASKFVRRNRGRVIAASLLGVALVAGLIGTSVGFINADEQKNIAEEQRDLARDEKIRADEKADEALDAREEAVRNLYTANMLSACDAEALNLRARAQGFLQASPRELRGWEWNVINTQLEKSIRAVPVPLPTSGDTREYNFLMHPDGQSFFTNFIYHDVASQHWSMDGELLAEFNHPGGPERLSLTRTRIQLSPDGSRVIGLAWMSENQPRAPIPVSVWDARTSAIIARHEVIANHDESLTSQPLMSPDGLHISLCGERQTWIQNVESGETTASVETTIQPEMRWFNRDGTRILCADVHGNAELRDGRTLDLIAPLDGHGNALRDVDFSEDGRWLATAAIDNSARVWDLSADPPTSIAFEHPQALSSAKLSPNSTILATLCSDSAIRIWDARTGDLQMILASENLREGSLLFLPDGQTIAAHDMDGTLRFWDLTAESTIKMRGHAGLVNAAYFAEETGLIVSIGWDGWNGLPGCVKLWDAETGDMVTSLGRPGELALELAISDDGMRAAVSLRAVKTEEPVRADLVRQNAVLIIDLETGAMTEIAGNAERLAFNPAEDELALMTATHLRIHNARDGSLLRERQLAESPTTLHWIKWSPDGRYIGLQKNRGDDALDREILTADTLRPVHHLDPAPFLHGATFSFTPDGLHLLVGEAPASWPVRSTESGSLTVLEVGSWQIVEVIDHSKPVPHNDLAVQPGGNRIATRNDREGEIIIWSADTYERVARFREPGFLATVAWSDDGQRLIGACGRVVRVWDDTPLRDRINARRARHAAMEFVTPLVERLLAEHSDNVETVLARIDADTSLSVVARKTARQEVLRLRLKEQ